MKKLFAVLLVVFLSCFSLAAEEVPFDWSILIAKELEELSPVDIARGKSEKIDEKTVKLSITKETVKSYNPKSTLIVQRDYYFRFNLTPQEEADDRLKFLEKGAELFYYGGEIEVSNIEDRKEYAFFFEEFSALEKTSNTKETRVSLISPYANSDTKYWLTHYVVIQVSELITTYNY